MVLLNDVLAIIQTIAQHVGLLGTSAELHNQAPAILAKAAESAQGQRQQRAEQKRFGSTSKRRVRRRNRDGYDRNVDPPSSSTATTQAPAMPSHPLHAADDFRVALPVDVHTPAFNPALAPAIDALPFRLDLDPFTDDAAAWSALQLPVFDDVGFGFDDGAEFP